MKVFAFSLNAFVVLYFCLVFVLLCFGSGLFIIFKLMLVVFTIFFMPTNRNGISPTLKRATTTQGMQEEKACRTIAGIWDILLCSLLL